jgi:hypothetical protein
MYMPFITLVQLYYEHMAGLRSTVYGLAELGYTVQERGRIIRGVWRLWSLEAENA